MNSSAKILTVLLLGFVCLSAIIASGADAPQESAFSDLQDLKRKANAEIREESAIRNQRYRKSVNILIGINVAFTAVYGVFYRGRRRFNLLEKCNVEYKKRFSRPNLTWKLWAIGFPVIAVLGYCAILFSPHRHGMGLSFSESAEIVFYFFLMFNLFCFPYVFLRAAIYFLCCRIAKEPL